MLKNKSYEIKLKLTAPRKIRNDFKNCERKGGLYGLVLLNRENNIATKLTYSESSLRLMENLKNKRIKGLPEIKEIFYNIGNVFIINEKKTINAYSTKIYKKLDDINKDKIEKFCAFILSKRLECMQTASKDRFINQNDINEYEIKEAIKYCNKNLKSLLDAMIYLEYFIDHSRKNNLKVKLDLYDPSDILLSDSGQLIVIDPIA